MTTRLQLRRDTSANWAASNPILAAGEAGWDTDIGALKIGDGTTAWSSLPYAPYRQQVRRLTAANWASANPTLAAGEFGYETDSGALKIGDGSTAWTSLSYVADDFHYQYTSAGSALGTAIADYFPANSSPSLLANSTYTIEAKLYFLKTTSGTVAWTWLASSAPSMMFSEYIGTAVTGFTTTVTTAAPITGAAAIQTNTTLAHAATSALTTAVYHVHTIRAHVRTNLATNLRLRVTNGAGTVTPQAGSFLTAKLIYNHGPTAA